MSISISKLTHRIAPLAAIVALVAAMGGTWMTAGAASAAPAHRTAMATPAGAGPDRARPVKKEPTGKVNLNTATEEQLMLLPAVGPAKAARIVTWRKKNGGFKRIADLRRVKGFGYKTFKRLAPYLTVKGETTLAAKR